MLKNLNKSTSLTNSFAGEIAFTDRHALQRAQEHPIYFVDDGTPLASTIMAKLGPSGVLMTIGFP
jgi:hypothetical protein